MKRIFFSSLLSVLIVSLSACTKNCNDSKNLEAPTLKIGTNANFPPFETIDEKGQLVGFDIDVGRALAAEMGREAEFKEFDFDALILALKKGQIDVIMSGMSITESRKQEIAMVIYQGKPLTEISFLFWDQLPQTISNFEDLKNAGEASHLAINVQSGHFLEEFLKGLGINVKPLPGPPEQILDVKYKKSLAAALDSANAQTLAAKHDSIKVVTLALPKDRWDLGNGIGINKSRPDLIEKVSHAVQALKNKGTIKVLEQKWITGGQQ